MATKSIEIPPFAATDLKSVSAKCNTAAAAFRTNRTKDLAYRKTQLRKLYWATIDYTPQLIEALRRDLNKSAYESRMTEIDFVTNDCLFLLSQLDKLAADEKLGSPDIGLSFYAAGLRTRKEPLGAVLIIGAYNYPVNLLLCPLVGAIAAGCTAVVKPSEVAPNVAMVLKELIESALDPEAYSVVNGAVPETTALLDFRDPGELGQIDGEERGWGKIFYTGGRQVARIVAAKAAQTLTPVTLELGGRNPAFVTANADLALAARRLLWGKTLGAGQVCMSANYILVQRDVVDAFIQGLKDAHKKTFPNGARNSELAHIANERHFARIKKMLDDTKGKIVLGGEMDQKTLFMEPTCVLVDSVEDPMIQQESFGPIFSILPVDSLPSAIHIANQVDPTPLSLYTFGSKAENEKVLREVNSGGASINDSFMHGSPNTVSFGGVGHSGTGAYRGRASFDVFTHRRTVAETPSWMEGLLRVRYMPYDWSNRRMVDFLAAKPNFDRNGNVNKGLGYWLRLVLGLGSRNAQEPSATPVTNGHA
ncbi:aldehyde dehydrogenase (NAD(P)+) [Sporothrix brasiliensis 5110]|uniref:Aldehyde dehydrogenase n=1 Tax=Sporothrix brasiliensis 5110 TaxID=1398154 RepID=A0A0C2ISY9_9PEZI|nr:aldehyde dehydrogenase (NAD(P)+) [Sporothrix brasiliensis 5110]KIH88112.1 aldehyde dehydrogenase (NAD(P)+) [Sporothrix brasiliensis 5110]